MNFRNRFVCLAGALLSSVLLAGGSVPAHAQAQPRAIHDPQDLINWYYSATFGTGVYQSGDRTVTVLQLPFSRILREGDEDTWGLSFKFPITVGFYDYEFDDVFAGDLPNAISTVSIMPGLEWEMPLTSRWTIKPYFSAGVGQEVSGHESALIYDFGIKSRFRLGADQGVEIALVNAITAAGYRPRGGPSQPFGRFAIGLDLVIPTNTVLFDRAAFIGFTPSYSYYFNKLNFAEFDDADKRMREQIELAVSVMSRKPWSLKYFDIDRVGLAFRSGDEVIGVSLFTTLPF